MLLSRTLPLLMLASSAYAQPMSAAAAPKVTLAEALRTAAERSPALAGARAAIEQAEAGRVAADTYPHNPEFAGEAAARIGEHDTTADWSVGLQQTVQVGGQTARRREVADAALAQARAEYEVAARQLAARVHFAFVDAVAARDLVAVEETHAGLTASLVEVAQKRFDAGAATRLDVNLARVQAGRAAGRVAAARGVYRVANTLLAEAMAADAAVAPEPAGTLDPPSADIPAFSALLDAARTRRAELLVLRRAREAARARIAAADAEGTPNLGLSVFVGREAAVDTLVGGGVSISLPLFNTNQGAVAEARAAERRVEAEAAAVTARVEQEVLAAAIELQVALETVQALQGQVVGTFEENLLLLQQSFEAGKIGGAEVLTTRSEFRESRRELVEALAAAWSARVQLDVATGELGLPARDPGSEVRQ